MASRIPMLASVVMTFRARTGSAMIVLSVVASANNEGGPSHFVSSSLIWRGSDRSCSDRAERLTATRSGHPARHHSEHYPTAYTRTHLLSGSPTAAVWAVRT